MRKKDFERAQVANAPAWPERSADQVSSIDVINRKEREYALSTYRNSTISSCQARRKSQMTTTQLTRIAILTALASVLRLVFGAFPNIKPITALFFVILLAYGLGEAICVSSLTMLVTGFLMGFSIIILGQMISYAVILSLGYVMFKRLHHLGLRTGAVFLLTMCYGVMISLFAAQIFGSAFWPFWLGGLSFDLAHAVSTAIFFPILLTIFKTILKVDLK